MDKVAVWLCKTATGGEKKMNISILWVVVEWLTLAWMHILVLGGGPRPILLRYSACALVLVITRHIITPTPIHLGRGPMETSDYIVNTLKTLVQFTRPFTTRYILGTFQMLPCHLSNMCSQNNISNVSRILPQMFPIYTQKSHADQSEKNWAHAEHIYNVPM